MRTGGHSRVERDPADVATHDLDDHAALVGLRGRADAVDGLRGDLHGRVEAERVVGGVEVVVDRLRHAHDLEAGVGEPLGGGEGALSTDRDERIHADAIERGLHVLGAAVGSLEGIRAARSEDGAALLAEAANGVAVERHREALDDTLPSVADSDEGLVVDLRPLEDGAADDRVQSGTVPTAREHTNSHRVRLSTQVAAVLSLARSPPSRP